MRLQSRRSRARFKEGKLKKVHLGGKKVQATFDTKAHNCLEVIASLGEIKPQETPFQTSVQVNLTAPCSCSMCCRVTAEMNTHLLAIRISCSTPFRRRNNTAEAADILESSLGMCYPHRPSSTFVLCVKQQIADEFPVRGRNRCATAARSGSLVSVSEANDFSGSHSLPGR